MSDLSLLDLDSPKSPLSNKERKSSAISSWGDSNISDKDEVPVHLFLSPTHSNSTRSSGTNIKTLQKRKKEKNTEETSFSFAQERNLKVSIYPDDDADIVLSSPSQSQEYNSSESEDSSSNKIKTLKNSCVKPKSKFRTNKVHNFNFAEDQNIEKIEESEMDNESKLLEKKKKEETTNSSDLFNFSADNEPRKSIIPASDLSYRERIRDRFNTMKEKAVESLSRPQSRAQSKSKLKTLIVKQGGGGQIIENLLKLEENEITEALERHEKIRGRWKEAYKASIEREHKLNEEYDFFSDNEKIPSTLNVSEENSKVCSDFDKKENGQTDSKMLTSEFLGFKDDWDVTEFVEPKTFDSKSIKIWEENLFCPSNRSVSIQDKLEPGLNPRHIENEGIYVEKKINVPKKIKNKLEQRLLQTPEGRKWFGKDGELISSSCPLSSISLRPYVSDESSQISGQLVWKEPIVSSLNYRFVDPSGNMNHVLDIDIHSIEFSHHPLFSREHVLAQRFKELYIKHQKRKKMDNLNRLNGRLNALRKTRDNLKNILLAGGDNLDISSKLEKYENDIKEVRKMRYLEGQIDKQLTNKIIMTWKDLVKLREQQGYQTTSVKLNIKKNSFEDIEAEKVKWVSDIKKDTKEVIEELKFEYKKKFEEYTQQHQFWSQRKSKKEIEEIKEDSDGSEESSLEDDDFLKNEPQPPKPIVTSEIKTEITEIFKESFRCPGEPDFEFTLSTDTNVEGTAYNNKEELRKSAVKRCFIFVKLFYNGKEVCRTNSQPLNQKFSISISQRFAVRILEWPETLMLEIHEETGTFNKNLLVSGIYLPFPDCHTTVENSDVIKYEFSSKITASFNHSGVGSGCKIIPNPDGSEFNNKPVWLYTSGTIACRLGWVSNQGNVLAPPENYWNFIKNDTTSNLSEILLSDGVVDMEKLKEWALQSNLDPYDPCNTAFFYFLDNNEKIEKSEHSYFRLNSLMDEFNFCEEEDIENNIRLKLLHLRNVGEPEFIEAKMVPLNEKEIHRDIFKDYEKRQSTPETLTDILSSDPLDGHRLWGHKYLEQVQQKLLQQCRTNKRTKKYHDIIMEDNVPDIGTLGLSFMKGLRPKRPLHPERKARKKITPQNLMGQEVKIIVNVVRAFEVPVRKDIDSMSSENNIDGFSLVNVRPFVEISFQGITARTTSAEGANPTWNQDLQIPIKNKNGYLPGGTFQSMKDTIYLHLFDERVIDLVEDDSIRETNIHQRLEKHWLASMEIPFFTLYFNSRIEGTFKLYSPPVLLGYEREAHRVHVSNTSGVNHILPQRDATYITLFVTVQPALNPPKPLEEKMECSEPLNLEKHLESWQKEVMTAFPHRKIKTLVLDITGKFVCVTRFVKPLPLPSIIEEKEENMTVEMVARFVAMIPLIAEGNVISGFFDFWLTADQFLRLLCGDSEDHAILLCCYFLELGLQSYVLLGSGIPHGSTAYVLVKEIVDKKSEYFIWDATNGQKYNVNDSFCPLQKIYCLINDQNIWANVQAEESPRRTRFDLTRRADWFPAFGKNISPPTASIQPQILEYKATSREAVDLLQDKLEKKLRDSIMKWRKRSRTQWNRYCAATLRKLLPDLEQSSWNIEKETPDHIIQLQHILASHKVCGFPINMAYTNIDTIIEAVKATGVHCKEGEEVEFALAAYIHPYPNNILSVWVYVASLVRRR